MREHNILVLILHSWCEAQAPDLSEVLELPVVFFSSYFVKILHRFLKTPKGIHSEGVYFDAAFPWGLFLLLVCLGFF